MGENEAPKFSDGLHGIVITGWQRYDHFATLCELLPAGIPSMALNLLSVSSGTVHSPLHPVVSLTISWTETQPNKGTLASVLIAEGTEP